MAVEIVDSFEIIDIKQRQGIGHPAGIQRGDMRIERSAIEYAGQRIGSGQPERIFFGQQHFADQTRNQQRRNHHRQPGESGRCQDEP